MQDNNGNLLPLCGGSSPGDSAPKGQVPQGQAFESSLHSKQDKDVNNHITEMKKIASQLLTLMYEFSKLRTRLENINMLDISNDIKAGHGWIMSGYLKINKKYKGEQDEGT